MKKGSKSSVIIFIVITLALLALAIFGLGNQVKGVREIRYGIDIRGGVEAVFKPETQETPSASDLESARVVIETRLDNENITDREVTIDKEGGYIIVRFPWKSDETDYNPEEAIAELGEMAELQFRDPSGNVVVEGKDVTSASPEAQREDNGTTSYVVALTFDSAGADKFAEATGRLVGQQIGIYMDETLLSNPVVQTQITGGQAVITGMEDYAAAEDLANKINAGALPFSLETRSFSTISPSLGQNALQVMMYAGLAAFILVCLFMMFFYKLPGIVACMTLLLQMILQLLAISIPQYTLTLPGMAGVILSLGMAVDANIIIAERISEEIRNGETVKSAVASGYKRAFTSVLDGNITTAIVAIVLMIFGSGTMLSFGYTLLIGVIVNCFVGVNVSRTIIRSLLEYPALNKEKFFVEKRERKTIKFFENKRIAAIVTVIIVAAGIIGLATKGARIDTQFTGGTVLQYEVTGDVNTEKISADVEKVTGRPATVQITKSNIDASSAVLITLAGNTGITPEEQKSISEAIAGEFGLEEITPSQTYAVEPYIGAKAMRNAVIAIIVSFGCILAYIGIRFSVLSGLSAGLTALVALLHDVMVVFFAFVLFGIPLGDSFVAVVLTIIGYSINDTIVVYDRIRENTNNNPRRTLTDQIDISLTQVMTRSINTSITTGLCVLVILAASLYFNITSIYRFSLPMFFGVVSGAYSSLCIASILWGIMKSKKQTAESAPAAVEAQANDNSNSKNSKKKK
ncbi:MAG: protein translocase subunit SecD [Lachnospiraceae bacterium]|nr:protein translocase subunit SecD [Lachnospiraceae bacterium]